MVLNAFPLWLETLSMDEYLARELGYGSRLECVAGYAYAVAGESQRHNLIVSNLLVALGTAAKHSPCHIFSQGMKLRLTPDTFYYPDVVMVCDPTDDADHFVKRPSLIVEVLSDSTASIDMREKLLAYHQIESLQTYLIVAQDVPQVLHHWRDETGIWQRRHFLGFGTIPIPNLEAVLTLKSMYARIFDLQEL